MKKWFTGKGWVTETRVYICKYFITSYKFYSVATRIIWIQFKSSNWQSALCIKCHISSILCVYVLHTDNAFETHLCSTKFIISNFNSQDFLSSYVWYKTIYETKLQYVLMLISNSVLSFYLKGIENALHFIIIDLKALKNEIDLTFNGVNIKPIWIIWEAILNLVFSDSDRECN